MCQCLVECLLVGQFGHSLAILGSKWSLAASIRVYLQTKDLISALGSAVVDRPDRFARRMLMCSFVLPSQTSFSLMTPP